MRLHSLMFGWEYPPLHSGGLGVACQGLVRGLLKHNIGITLVLPVAAKSDDPIEIRTPIAGVEGVSVDVRNVISLLQPYDTEISYAERLQRVAHANLGTNVYGPDFELAVERYTAQSVDLTRDVAADVVHCHDWMTFEAGIHASKHHDKPLVTHVHATELDRTDFQPNPWIANIEKNGLQAADRVIAVSNYTKQMLQEHYGIEGEKISVVHSGHDVSPNAPKPTVRATTQPMVLFLGRLTVQKNPWQFLEVAKLLHDARPEIRFVMAGDGPMLGALVERAVQLGLADCVTFTGKVSREEAERIFREASCFVMPSLSEPFGLVALEAIGHGVPVVLSKQSGASEVIDHAFKVDFWDTDKMADCILTILREEPLAQQLRTEAPHLLKRLNWHNQANLIRSIYHRLLPA